jgi:hypothetical protein
MAKKICEMCGKPFKGEMLTCSVICDLRHLDQMALEKSEESTVILAGNQTNKDSDDDGEDTTKLDRPHVPKGEG